MSNSLQDDSRGKANPVTNFFVNTIVTALQAPEWETLLQRYGILLAGLLMLILSRIGVDAMIHLLTETSVFVTLPNGCLCQMTGHPIHLRAPPKKDILPAPSRGKKRRRLKDPASDRPTKRLRFVDGYPSSSKSTVTTYLPLCRHSIFLTNF